MRKHIAAFGFVLFAVLLAVALVCNLYLRVATVADYRTIDRPAKIYPDYSSTVIPPNIAPLNFMVQEKGSYYCARIYSERGEPIEIFSRSPKILIPIDSWHELLDKNKGNELHFDIFVRMDSQDWVRFETITNRIADEDIDSFLVYRKIHPVHVTWSKIGIYQRNLQNYDESPVLDNHIGNDCLNCHTFCRNHPDKMLICIRNKEGGGATLLVEDSVVNKVGTKFGYTSWHPSGQLAVYSINKVRQFFHTTRNEVRDVIDLDSSLAYYLVDSKTVKTSPMLAQRNRLETYPTWSADGRHLYFCSAPLPRGIEDKFPPEGYEHIKYDLVRVSYDLEHDQWGEVETVLSAQDTGQSILLPRISPDGRWLLFCMCNYGCFPVYQQSSDLYLMDLRSAEDTGRYKYHRLDINSDRSESWHSWSSNSRWIVFSSKREHGVFTKSYLSYIDETGRAYKPLILPQKDPTFYGHCLKTFNTPEFVIEPIMPTGERLFRIFHDSTEVFVDMPVTMATPKAGAIPSDGESWAERE
jgi:hypothetical protein